MSFSHQLKRKLDWEVKFRSNQQPFSIYSLCALTLIGLADRMLTGFSKQCLFTF